MKRLFILLIITIGLLNFSSVEAQESIYWIGGNSGDWNEVTNWSPESVPTAADTAVFDSGIPVSVNFNPPGGQTGGLVVKGSTDVEFSSNMHATLTFEQMRVESNSSLSLAENSGYTINISIIVKAEIYGELFMDVTEHKVYASNFDVIFFMPGSRCIIGPSYPSFAYPFGNGTSNEWSVDFQDGSTYEHHGGASPFGTSANPVCYFAPRSNYEIHHDGSLVDINGRIYGNFINAHTGDVSVVSSTTASSVSTFGDIRAIGGNFYIEGTQTDRFEFIGDSIDAENGYIDITTGDAGFEFMSDTTYIKGIDWNSVTISVNSSTTNTITALKQNQTLILDQNLRLEQTTGDITLEIKGILDLRQSTLDLDALTLRLAPSAVLKTAHTNGFAGNFVKINSASINCDPGIKLIFNGTSAQDAGVYVLERIDYRAVALNNPDGLTMDSNITVSDSLYLTEGVLNISNNSFTFNGALETVNDRLGAMAGSWLYIGGTGAGYTIPFAGSPWNEIGHYNQNRAAIIKFNSDIQITDQLDFDAGKLAVENARLTLGETVNDLYSSETNNYILTPSGGEVSKILSAGETYRFHVGDISSGYTPVEITANAADTYTIKTFHGILDGGLIGGAITDESFVQKTWGVNTDLASSDYQLDLFWPSAIEGSLFDSSNAFITHYNGSEWTSGTGTTVSSDGATGLKKLSESQNTSGAFSVKSPTNILPTSMDISYEICQDIEFIFTDADFHFSDSDGGTFTSLMITDLPADGTLYLDATNPGIIDAGEEITVSQIIPIADLQNGYLTFRPDPGGTGDPYASFLFAVSDGINFSSPSNTAEIIINPNNPPTATDNSQSITEDISITVNFAMLGYNDSDSHLCDGIEIQNTVTAGELFLDANGNGTNDGEDVMANDYILKTDIDNNKLVFKPAPDENGSPYTSFDFIVFDECLMPSSNSYTLSFDVAPENDGPTTNNSAITVMQDYPYIFSLGDFPYSDIENDLISEVYVYLPVNGQLFLDADADGLLDAGEEITTPQSVLKNSIELGHLAYMPAAGSFGNGIDNFDFQVKDGSIYSGIATMTIHATQNNPPLITAGTVTAQEDVAYYFTQADFGYSDPDGHALGGIWIQSNPTAGTLWFDDGTTPFILNTGDFISADDLTNGFFYFQPDTDENGSPYTNFTFEAEDEYGATSSIKNMTINVTAQNDPPTSANETLNVIQNVPHVLLESDFPYLDIESDPFAGIKIAAVPLQGTLFIDADDDAIPDAGEILSANDIVSSAQISSGNFVYMPPAGISGLDADEFQFHVFDGTDYSYDYLMTINIQANEQPSASNAFAETRINTVYNFVFADLNFSDPDGNGFGGVLIETLPSQGFLFLDTNSNGTYEAGTDILADAADLPLYIDVVNFNNGELHYSPPVDISGLFSFTFSVFDEWGAISSTNYTFEIKVNTPPTSSNNTVETFDDTDYTFKAGDFLFDDSDADDQSEGLQSVYIATEPSTGTLYSDEDLSGDFNAGDIVIGNSIELPVADFSDEKIKYEPVAGSPYTTSFNFLVGDGTDLSSFEYTMTINVNRANQAPTTSNSSISIPYETLTVFNLSNFNHNDADSDPLDSLFIDTAPIYGSLFVDRNSNSTIDTGEALSAGEGVSSSDFSNDYFKYQPNTGYSGTDAFDFYISDGTDYSNISTMTITIGAPPNTPPTAANASVDLFENEDFVFSENDFGFSDSDAGDVLTEIEIVSLTSITGGTLFLDSNNDQIIDIGETLSDGSFVSVSDINAGYLLFRPDAGSAGSSQVFSFAVSDGTDFSSTYNFTLNILAPPNNAPTAANASVDLFENEDFVFSEIDFGFSDPDDGDSMEELEIISIADLTAGTLFLDDGAISELTAGSIVSITDINAGYLLFTPDVGSAGTSQVFTFRVSDGTEFSGTYNFTLNILAPPNNAPTAANASVDLYENEDFVFSEIDFGFSDPDAGDSMEELEIISVADLTGGTLFLDDGTISELTAGSIVNISDISADNMYFTPDVGSAGTSQVFTFRVSDGTEFSGTYNFTLNIQAPLNTLPEASNNTVTIAMNEQYTFVEEEFGFYDEDPDDVFTNLKIEQNVTAGILFVDYNQNGIYDSGTEDVDYSTVVSADDIRAEKLKYKPNTDHTGSPADAFAFSVSDGEAYSALSYTMQINVIGNRPPTASYQEFFTDTDAQNGDIIGTLYAEDPDGDNISFEVLTGNTDAFAIAQNGEITVADASLLVGNEEFSFNLEAKDDGSPAEAASFNIKIFVEQLSEELFFSNYFSPNGDGHNDTWLVGGDLSQLEGYTLRIFNSNGSIVFQSQSYDNSWNGTSGGQALPAGVYYYLFEKENDEIRGSITLGR